jgi:hypothetical protein
MVATLLMNWPLNPPQNINYYYTGQPDKYKAWRFQDNLNSKTNRLLTTAVCEEEQTNH